MVNVDRVDFSNRSRHAARAKDKRICDFHRDKFTCVEFFRSLPVDFFLHRAEITEAGVCLEHTQCALKDAPQWCAVFFFVMFSTKTNQKCWLAERVFVLQIFFIYNISMSSCSFHREHQEDCWQIIYQVHPWHQGWHQKWQNRGQSAGKSLLSVCSLRVFFLMGLRAPLTLSCWCTRTPQSCSLTTLTHASCMCSTFHVNSHCSIHRSVTTVTAEVPGD